MPPGKPAWLTLGQVTRAWGKSRFCSRTFYSPSPSPHPGLQQVPHLQLYPGPRAHFLACVPNHILPWKHHPWLPWAPESPTSALGLLVKASCPSGLTLLSLCSDHGNFSPLYLSIRPGLETPLPPSSPARLPSQLFPDCRESSRHRHGPLSALSAILTVRIFTLDYRHEG